MKKNCYELKFKATRTLLNGNEKRSNITVLSPVVGGRFITDSELAKKGIKALKEAHYYDIEFLGMKVKTLLFTE